MLSGCHFLMRDNKASMPKTVAVAVFMCDDNEERHRRLALSGSIVLGLTPSGLWWGELTTIAALPENSHEFEKSWLLFVCVPIFLQLHWQKVNSFKWDLSAANLLLDYKDRYARPFVRHIDIALLAMMQLPEKPGNSSQHLFMNAALFSCSWPKPSSNTNDWRTIFVHNPAFLFEGFQIQG